MKNSLAIASTVALLAAAVAAPAAAGIHYRAVTKTVTERGDQVMQVEAWVEGDDAKVAFTASANPLMPAGSYLLTTDGGKKVVLVNPEEKTYAAFDLGAVMASAGAMLGAMGPLVKINFSNHKVEKLAAEPGPTLLGYPTTHYRVKTSYDSVVKVMGMGQESHNETITDTWATTALSDAGLGVWLRSEPPRTGIPGLDDFVREQVAAQGITGVPLKMTTVTKSRDKRGRESQQTTTMEVTTLEQQAIADGTFRLPAGYSETELLPTMPDRQ